MEKPEKILQDFGSRHPGIWKYVEACRATKGQGHDWPNWCYLPVTATYSYIAEETALALGAEEPSELTQHMKDDPAHMMAAVYDCSLASALAAWRMGRGIYRFDADFAAALVETPLDGELPVDLLLHLPEWCVYVDWQDPGERVDGFFAALEWDLKREEPELRLYINVEGDPFPTLLQLPLTANTILGMLDGLWSRIRENSSMLDIKADPVIAAFETEPRLAGIIRHTLPKIINLLLYLCSPEADYHGQERPRNPSAIKTKRGPRIFPAPTARIWKIGERTGNLLRQARQTPHQPEERNAPRPHLRRAHWHTYRVGQKRQGFRVRWLHPILVGYSEE